MLIRPICSDVRGLKPMFRRTTPLAWKNLTHDPRRLGIALAGVGFAVILMYMELGFFHSLLDSTVQLTEKLNADIVLLNRARQVTSGRDQFSIRRIYQAESCPGVASVYPIYIERIPRMRKRDRKAYPIRVLAFRDDDPAFNIPELYEHLEAVRRPGAALFDVASRAVHQVSRDPSAIQAHQAELAGRRVELVGHFKLGIDFACDGNLLMTAENLAQFFPRRAGSGNPLDVVDLAAVRVRPGTSPAQVAMELNERLPNDMVAYTKAEFIDREKTFWRTNAPIGYIFTVGAVMGFVVGVIIVYQIIYSDIADHLSEFATMKAMGYGNGYFLRLVLAQSLYLSVLGFVPGALISAGSYWGLARGTGLLMHFRWDTSLLVASFTMFMCILSGVLALRKLMSADPAELF